LTSPWSLSHSRANHEREDVDVTERELNAFDMEPLYDAWLCGTQIPSYSRMTEAYFNKLLGNRNTLPQRLAKGVGRDLMRAIGYALNHVQLAEDKGEASDHAPDA
jgi:hypothetical protein